MGSVFSPHYARAHKKAPGSAEPQDFVAINLALYGQKKAWVFTEAKARAGDVREDALTAGGNTWRYTEDGIELSICDRSVPWGRPVVGRITFTGIGGRGPGPRAIDRSGRHQWWPMMPVGRIEVAMEHPKLRWEGHAYHDVNWGDEPLKDGFKAWSWMRTTSAAGTRIVYAAQTRCASGPARTGYDTAVSLQVNKDGTHALMPMPKLHALPPSGWRIRGEGYKEGSGPITLLEDTPFYRRSTWTTPSPTGPEVTFHETLDMDRWGEGWVQALMHFRLRRARP